MTNIGKPYEGKPHVRFDEEGQVLSALYSSEPVVDAGVGAVDACKSAGLLTNNRQIGRMPVKVQVFATDLAQTKRVDRNACTIAGIPHV